MPVEMTATTAASRAGARLFESRRWIHPLLLAVAMALGGARHDLMFAGGALLALYLALRLWCCRHIRGAARVHARKAQVTRVLVTGGPFGLVRNPLYLANTVGIAGACLLFGPAWFAGVAAAASLAWYALVVRWEESVLLRLYPDHYPTYCALVPRFVPRLHHAVGLPGPDTRDDYPWHKVLRRERGAIGLTALLVLLAMLGVHAH